MTLTVQDWRNRIKAYAETIYTSTDPSHDMAHIERVVSWALKIAEAEKANLWVVIPAAYLHDMVNVPKDDPRRKQASRLSAAAAVAWLQGQGYPAEYLDAISHAIAAHSFSAAITPETIEAKIVQDADRLDALGAIGIARCFVVNGQMGSSFYDADDFFAENRPLDDKRYAVDHFFVKLFKIVETMHTPTAKAESARRTAVMKGFLQDLKADSDAA